MSISSSNSATYNVFNALGIKTNGIGGLASGLDTDSLVESMTISTRSRIATQQQKRQTLLWKQSAYRNVAGALQTFQNKYFSYTNSTNNNILSGEFFNVYKSTSNNSSISVSGGNANTNFTITSVDQLATAQYLTQKQTLSTTLVGTEVVSKIGTNAFAGETITLDVDGTVKTIKLDYLDTAANATDLELFMQELIDDAFGTDMLGNSFVKVELDSSDCFEITSNTATVYVTYDTKASNVLGFKPGGVNRVDLDTKISDVIFNGAKLQGDVFKFEINGAEITVKGSDTLSTLRSRINNSMANVTLTYNAVTDEFRLTSKLYGGGNNLEIKDNQGNLMNLMFGSASGSSIGSNELLDKSSISSVDFNGMNATEQEAFLKSLKDMTFNLKIDGKSYSVRMDTTKINDLIDNIGVTTDTAALALMLNEAVEDALGNPLASYGFVFADDGSGVLEIQFDDPDNKTAVTISNSSDAKDFVGLLGFDGERSITNIFTLTADNADQLTFDKLGIVYPFTIAVFDGVTEHSIGPYTVDTTIEDFIADINASGVATADIVDGRIVFTLLDPSYTLRSYDPSTNVLNHLFGLQDNTAYAFETEGEDYTLPSGDRMVRGVNAQLTILDDNGTAIPLVYNNNTFDLYGVTITLNELYEAQYDSVQQKYIDPIIVRTDIDPDDVVERLKGFIDEYNTIIELINSYIYEEKKSDFTALSDEQKASLSTSEIEKIEAEAKKGILRSDDTLRGIVQQLRSAVYQVVDSAGIAGYSIGITTVGILNSSGSVNQLDNGKLEITEDGEATLRSALMTNPDMVREFFTNSDDGLSVRFNRIISDACNPSSDPEQRGSLIRLAGTEGLTGDNTSVIGNQIDMIDKTLSTLKLRLEKEYNRYWQQFTRLEVALQNLSSQSSWLYDYAAS